MGENSQTVVSQDWRNESASSPDQCIIEALFILKVIVQHLLRACSGSASCHGYIFRELILRISEAVSRCSRRIVLRITDRQVARRVYENIVSCIIAGDRYRISRATYQIKISCSRSPAGRYSKSYWQRHLRKARGPVEPIDGRKNECEENYRENDQADGFRSLPTFIKIVQNVRQSDKIKRKGNCLCTFVRGRLVSCLLSSRGLRLVQLLQLK